MKIRYDPEIMDTVDTDMFSGWSKYVSSLVVWKRTPQGHKFWKTLKDSETDAGFFLVSNVYDEWYGYIMLTHKD